MRGPRSAKRFTLADVARKPYLALPLLLIILLLTACPPPPAPTIDTFEASELSVMLGDTLTLSWTVSNAGGSTCILSIDIAADNTVEQTEDVACASASFDHTPDQAVPHQYQLQVVRANSSTVVDFEKLTVTVLADTTPPTVLAVDPADTSSDVPLDSNIRITFSEAMNRSATEGAVSTTPQVNCDFAWDAGGTILTCDPAADLSGGTSYDVTIATAAEDLAANGLETPFGFGFTTLDTGSATCIFDDSGTLFDDCLFGN